MLLRYLRAMIRFVTTRLRNPPRKEANQERAVPPVRAFDWQGNVALVIGGLVIVLFAVNVALTAFSGLRPGKTRQPVTT
jgi:hypothetical protein